VHTEIHTECAGCTVQDSAFLLRRSPPHFSSNLLLVPTLATQGQIPQMPPESGGICMGVESRNHRLLRKIDLILALGLPPGWLKSPLLSSSALKNTEEVLSCPALHNHDDPNPRSWGRYSSWSTRNPTPETLIPHPYNLHPTPYHQEERFTRGLG